MRSGKQVYFLRPEGAEGPIKIGCSIRPKARMVEFSRWSPLPLEIAAVADGGHEHERMLHRMFAAHRLHGEWFSASPDLIDLIGRVGLGESLPQPPVKASAEVGFDHERAVAMRDLRRSGQTLKEVAARYQLSRQRVKQIVDELWWREESAKRRGAKVSYRARQAAA